MLIGCPKLDEGDYTEKLTQIIRQNDIKSLTIVRMEVPCCGRHPAGRNHRPAAQREVYPLAGGHHRHGWEGGGLTGQLLKK